MVYKYFLPFLGLSTHSVNCLFCCAEAFSLTESHLIFAFVAWAFSDIAKTHVKELFPCVFLLGVLWFLCFPSVWGCRKLGHPQLGEAASRLMERSSGFLHLLLITMETGRGRGRWEEAVLTRMSAALSSSRNDQFPGDNASQPFMARPQNACIMNIYMALPMHYSKCFTNIALNNSRR